MRREWDAEIDACRVWILGGGILIGACVFSFAFLSFLDAKEGVIAAGLVLCGGMTLLRRPASPLALFAPFWLLLGWMALWPLITMRLTAPVEQAKALIGLALPLAFAACAGDLYGRAEARRSLRTALLASGYLVAALALAQHLGAAPALFPEFPEYGQPLYSVFGNQDLLGGYCAMILPLTLHALLHGASRHRWPHIPGLAILLWALAASGSRGAWLAGLAAMAVMGVAELRRRKLPAKSGAFVAAALLIAALLMSAGGASIMWQRSLSAVSGHDVGVRARIWYWDGATRMLKDNPLTGEGPGAFAQLSPRYCGAALHAPGGEQHFHNDLAILHAHCDPLEIGIEAGLPGVLLLLWAIWRMRKTRGPEWGALIAFGVFGLTSSPLYSAPHLLAALVCYGMLASTSEPRETLGGSRVTWITAPLLTAIGLLALWMRVEPSFLLRQADDAYYAGAEPSKAYLAALAHPWSGAEARKDCATASLEAGENATAFVLFRQTLEGSDAGEVHLGLAIAAMRLGRDAQARVHLQECLYRTPGAVHAWMRLASLTPYSEVPGLLREAERWLAPKDMARLRERCDERKEKQRD